MAKPDSTRAEAAAAESSSVSRSGEAALPPEAGLGRRIFLWLVPNFTAFMASFCIMVLELVAGRILARHLGSSLYTWTSVIAIVLGGISIGNLIGGRLADWFKPSTVLAVLFLLASGACLAIPLVNNWVDGWDSWGAKPEDVSWFVSLLHTFSGGEAPAEGAEQLLIPWSGRIFGHVLVVFLLPSTLLGTIGPVVAKMALDQGRQIGRTVGNVYSWGALGSIVGTLLTGFWLVSKLGTEAVVLSVGLTLGVMGIAFCLGRLWSSPGPAAAAISFLTISWVGLVPVVSMVALAKDWQLFSKEGKGWPYEWVEREGRTVLREKRDRGVLYIDESDYSYIKVEGETELDDTGEARTKKLELVLDNLTHAYFVPDEPKRLEYEYEDIYKAITHRFAPPEAEQEGGLKTLFIGGGGYVFPRYLRAIWPKCYVEVAEIDPAVTAADIAAFGLDAAGVQVVKRSADRQRTDNPFWVYHMDARNHVEDLVRRKEAGRPVPEFDYIYGDAFNDYAIPSHLTTREFNDKVKSLLKPGKGVYMINVIDIFQVKNERPGARTGQLLGAIYNTFRQTFGDHVYIFGCNEGKPSDARDTYIVIGAQRPLDLKDLPGTEDPYDFEGCLLTAEHLRTLTDDEHAGGLVITDDFAPVENLLQSVVNARRW